VRLAEKLALIVLAVIAVLAVAGCSSGSGQPSLGGVGAGVGVNDVNPAPRGGVRDGGDLRWPIDDLPDNFNFNQFAGTTDSTQAILGALMPYLFTSAADGTLVRDQDYLTSADVTAISPRQKVTYWINPKAAWSNGIPITWRDFEAQWKALNGSDPAFQVAGNTGYSDIESVRPGTDNQQVVVTFTQPFAEWQTLFSPLFPTSANSDPTTFNTGLVAALPVTSGPFELDSIDAGAQTVTVRRSDSWWGTPAKLNRIIFKVYDRSGLADALANNELDFYRIGSSVDLLARAQSIPGVAIRQSPERRYNQITFNGAPGATLSDVKLRQAIARGIDRTAIARLLVGPIVPDVAQLGNHIYPYGSKYYQDNSSVVAYNPVGANQALDALGWLRQTPDGVRSRGGVPLRLRLLEGVPNSTAQDIDRTVVAQLAQLGVQVVIRTTPLARQANDLRQGDFDLAGFAWEPTGAPFSSGQGIYEGPVGDNVQQNYGRVSDPRIDALFDRGLAQLDDANRAEVGNQVDQLLWQEVHDLPLYPSTGAYAVRANLANFGAPGFADIDYIDAGYLK
jgi:peptide/nickel transport system substrate-binding protein